jgi:hypothetical protein
MIFSQGTVRHLHFMIADHFEPYWGNAGEKIARQRMDRWSTDYPCRVSSVKDSFGRSPKHTFFYPEEEYDPIILDQLGSLCRYGGGDVEIHLHHDNDTSAGLREKLNRFKKTLHDSHGLLRKNPVTGEILYGFIHGNWALDNSRKDGKWCGVNDELRVLKETGCYADFTLPSAPSETQTTKINSIYYATDDVERPKSHDDGVDVEAGGIPAGDLMIIQGPLTLNWRSRKWGVFPRIENGELSCDAPVHPDRIRLWVLNAPQVIGKPEHRFLKIHTHGCNDKNFKYLLYSGGLTDLYGMLAEYCAKENIHLHFTDAFGMYRKVKELEGCDFIPA